jgi:hypothetical protein
VFLLRINKKNKGAAMFSYDSWQYKVMKSVNGIFSNAQWKGLRALFNHGIYYDLTEKDHDTLKPLLAKSYYIILTYRKAHLTTWLIGGINLIKTGKWGRYSHTLMNCDLEKDPDKWEKFKLLEATASGVHYSSFMEVFDCDAVCILEPRNITNKDWNTILDGLLKQKGYKYDDLFDITEQSRVSCVELVYNALRALPDYHEKFGAFDAMIAKVGNLTPQMYLDCPDFKKVLEIRR